VTMRFTTSHSPIGELLLVGDGAALCGLFMQDGPRPTALDPSWVRDERPFAAALAQLEEYFAGARTAFDLALAPAGTAFQQRVWAALREIPYGATTSYGALAARLGAPGASRAVGLANGRNPISVVVPCHRVVGADGSLTGFGGGTERKRALLDLEAGGRLFA
jgi:methylated-DNA-[protein]-cysteine S-methyltransferase